MTWWKRKAIRTKLVANTDEDRAVQAALSESARHLAETKAQEAELEPRFRRIEKALEHNHIHEAIVHTFRVVK